MAFVPGVRHLTRAKDLADRRYASPLRVDDLARVAGLSRAHFSREFRRHFGEDAEVLRPDLLASLDLDGYVDDGYRSAVGGIRRLDGESDFEYRMRQICHLHLTRFVRVLLDRKDRMSMAVGLEVRVPFCDHRLV